jgi:hypothetical protein
MNAYVQANDDRGSGTSKQIKAIDVQQATAKMVNCVWVGQRQTHSRTANTPTIVGSHAKALATPAGPSAPCSNIVNDTNGPLTTRTITTRVVLTKPRAQR